MENKEKKKEIKDFTTEYDEIINYSKKIPIVETQWRKPGDFFQKFTMYDESYVPVKTLGGTTLIKDL